MSIKGPSTFRLSKSDHAKRNKAWLALAQGKPMKAQKPRPTGLTYNRQEDKDRPEIARRMRRDGWELWRIEPYGKVGKKGFGWGDFWVHHHSQRMMGWVETKSATGTTQKIQEQRARESYECGVHYWVVRLDGEGYRMERIT